MQVWNFILAHQAAVASCLLAALPSLVVAATEHPGMLPEGAIAWLKMFLQLLSVLEHKDAETRFKLPLTTSKLPALFSVPLEPPPPGAP